MNEKEMKFCTYSWFNGEIPERIGKIVEGYNESYGYIRYHENQQYMNEPWIMNFVKVFDTFEDALTFLIEKSHKTFFEIKEDVYSSWQTESKKINWKELEKKYILHF